MIAVVVIWGLAMTGFTIARNSRMTAEKVKDFAASVDLSKLPPDRRADAIHKLAQMLNKLSIEERRRARLEQESWTWMSQMTEDEKAGFIEETLPTGFKQMINSFEQMPEERRKRAINDAVKRLREARQKIAGASGPENPPRGDAPPPLSPELQQKIQQIGLKTFYSQSSAQTKAELAPVLEELQHVMENGRLFRR